MTTDTLHKTSVTTPSDTEIRIERTFDAPRALLWEAFTDAEMMAEWLGPDNQTMTVDELDVRPGGSYRYTSRSGDGEYTFFGEFREVAKRELLVATFEWEGSGYPPSVDHTEFEELDSGHTRLITTSKFESEELRDGMLKSGMEGGVNDGYDKLDAIIARKQGES